MRLYRAVSRTELDDLRQFGGFRQHPDHRSMETKLFATSLDDARWWGEQLYGMVGESFIIVEVEVPDALARRLYRAEADAGRPFVAVADELLPEFNAGYLLT